jgi:hypothetical protein
MNAFPPPPPSSEYTRVYLRKGFNCVTTVPPPKAEPCLPDNTTLYYKQNGQMIQVGTKRFNANVYDTQNNLIGSLDQMASNAVNLNNFYIKAHVTGGRNKKNKTNRTTRKYKKRVTRATRKNKKTQKTQKTNKRKY